MVKFTLHLINQGYSCHSRLPVESKQRITMKYKENHYVPRWYQERFLPTTGQGKFRYLDLPPQNPRSGCRCQIARSNISNRLAAAGDQRPAVFGL
jgi:hypothetical protein